MLTIALSLLTHVSVAQEEVPAEKPKLEAPATKQNRIEDVQADEIEVKSKENVTRLELRGKVQIIGTEFRMRCAYAEAEQNQKGEFKMGFATGNVRIFLPDALLIGDRLDYDDKEKLVYLTGKDEQPKTYRDGKVIRADKIIYNMDAPKPKNGDRPINVKFKGKASVKDAKMPAEHAEVFPPVKKKVEKKPE
jgi:lipopolysaccharide export system protein LptA